MAIKKYGPTTPGRRGMTVTDYSVLSKVAPERSLLEPMKKHSGRNHTGRITVGAFPAGAAAVSTGLHSVPVFCRTSPSLVSASRRPSLW